MIVSSFSQTGYPKKIVYKGDTLILITPRQLDIINAEHILNESNIELSMELKKTIKRKDIVIIEYKDIIKIISTSTNGFDFVIEELKEVIEEKKEENKELKKSLRKSKFRNTMSSIGLSIAGGVIVAETIIILIGTK